MTTQIRAVTGPVKKCCSAVSIVGFKCEFFRRQDNPELLQNVRERMSSVNRQEAPVKRVRENEERIPLVPTYHPLSSRVKRILLNNFNILTRDTAITANLPSSTCSCTSTRLQPEISWYPPLRGLRQRYQELSHVNISAAALACTQRPTSMYMDPSGQPLSANALPVNQGTLCIASRAVDAPSYTSVRRVVLYANVSANIFGASKRTLVVSRSQST